MKLQFFHLSYATNWINQVLRRSPRRRSLFKRATLPIDEQAVGWIFARRSIRKFSPDPVEPEKIDRLLKAAMAAPSANSKCPWRFVVVQDRARLDRFATMHPYAKMCYESPLTIIVCADPAESENYWYQDCSAATQNILLAGTALGLGTVWIGVHPRESRKSEMRDLFQIPAEIEVFAAVAIGYPAQKKQPRTQYNRDHVSWEMWGGSTTDY